MALIRDANGKLQYVREDGTVAASSSGGWFKKKATTDQGAKDYNNFLYELDTFQRQMGADFKSREGKYQSSDTLGKTKTRTDERVAGMRKKIGEFRNYFNDNASLYGDEAVSNIFTQMGDAIKYLDAVRDSAQSEYDYWSQWETEKDYEETASEPSAALRRAAYESSDHRKLDLMERQHHSEKATPSYQSMLTQAQLSSIKQEEQKAAIQRELDPLNRQIAAQHEKVSSYSNLGMTKELQAAQAELERLYARYNELQYQINPSSKENAAQWEATMSGLIEASGKSKQIRDTYNLGQRVASQHWDKPTAGQRDLQQEYDRQYQALVSQFGEDMVKDWFAYLERSANQNTAQISKVQTARDVRTSTGKAITYNVASVPANLVSSAGYLDVLGQKIQRRITGSNVPIDYNTPAAAPGQFVKTVRGETSEIIEEKTEGKWGSDTAIGNLYSLLYNTSMSMADSAAVMFIPGGQFLLGGAAANSSMQDAIERGATDAEALTIGFFAGAAETVMEKMSIDSLFGLKKSKKPADIILNILKQSGAEGTEELLTSIANAVADHIIMGDKSQMQVQKQELMAQGYSEQEAEKMVKESFLWSLVADTVGGMLSGGTFSAMKGAVDLTTGRARRNTAKVNPKLIEAAMGKTPTGAQTQGTTAQSERNETAGVTTTPEAKTAQGAAERSVEEVTAQSVADLAAKSFGSTGQKAFATTLNEVAPDTPWGLFGGFSAYYQAGMTGKDIKAVKSTYANDLPTNFRQIAYDAGVRDAAASLRARSAGADSTVVHNDGQWVIENEYSESMNKDDVQVLSGVAQAIGKKIIFEDLGSDNGYYDADTGIIHLDIHAEDPLLDVMAHEVTHVMEDMAPVEHGRYRDFVMNAMAERLGIDTTALINGKKAEYASGGRTLSDEQAMNELVAEYTKQMMKDRNLFEAYAKKDLTGAQKLLEAFKRFLQKVKNLFQGNRQAQDAAVRERYGVSIEVAEEAARLWDEALNAVVARAKGENKNTTHEGGEVRQSKKGSIYTGKSMTEDGEIYSYDFLTALPDMNILLMPSLSEVKTNGQVDRSKAVAMGLKNAKNIGRTISDTVAAVQNRYTKREMVLSKSSLEHGLDTGAGTNIGRLRTNSRLAAIGGEIVANAVPVNSLRNKNRQATGTYTMATVLKSGDVAVVAIVTVEQHKNNVVDIDFVDITHAISGRLTKKEEVDGLPQGKQDTALRRLLATTTSTVKIADFLEIVNSTYQSILSDDVLNHFGETRNPKGYYSERVRFSAKGGSVLDSDYLDAVNRNDMKAAQRMVDEAAKEAGYTRTLYHGTPSKFNVFEFGRAGIYTTDNAEVAKSYGNNVMSLYGKQGAKVLTIDAKNSPHYAIRVSKDVLDFSSYPLLRGKELYSTDNIAQLAFAQGYDVVVIENVHDNFSAGSGNPENGLGTDVIYKDSSQIKSAEAVTYNDEGEVIPLSERFNLGKKDIRYSKKNEYSTKGTHWAVGNDLLSKGEQAKFWETIANVSKRGYYAPRTYDGEYIVDVGRKLIFTDGSFEAPTMSCIIEFNEEYEDNLTDFKEWILDEERNTSGHRESLQIIEILQGEGYVTEHLPESYPPNGRKDGRRERTDGGGDFEGNKGSVRDDKQRSSRKGGAVLDTAVARAEEAEALKQQIAYWKGQLKRTKGFQVDQKAVDKVAKGLIRTYQVDTDADELSAKLKTMYDGIATGYYGDTEIDYETYKARAEEVARLIVENAVETENEMYVEYAELRKYLRSITLNISPEDSQDIPDFGDFRKRNWGRMTIGSKGTNIDQVYKELSELWPEFFNEERETSPSDQLLRIAEVMEAVYRSQEVNPFGQYAEEAVSDIADEVMGYFFTIPQAVTFADKAAAKLKQARADATLAGQMAQGRKDAAALRRTEERAEATQQKLRDALETERGQNAARLKQDTADAKLAGQMAQGRKDAALLRSAEERAAAAQQRAKDALRKERERGAKVMQDLKDRQSAKDTRTREQRKAAELRGKIVRHAKALSKKLLSPTDKKHVPDELQSAVAAVLDAINLESNRDGAEKTTKRTQAFQKLRDAYKKVAGAVVVDPALFSGEGDQATAGSLLEAVLDMGDTRIADMNSEQLTTVWQVLKAVEASVRSADRLLAAKKYQHISEMAEQLQSDNALRRPKKGVQVSLGKKKTVYPLLDLEDPKTFFHKYGEVGDSLFRELRNAQDNQQRMTDEIAEAVKAIVTPKQVREMQKTVHEIKTEGGDTLYLTTAHIMEMYLLSKREQAQDHLLKGGIVQPEIQSEKIQRGTDMIRLSLTDMGNITGQLTQEQTRIADALQQLMTTKLADYGNAASMKAYGYKKFTGKDYWPIKSAQEALHSTAEKGANNTRSIKNIGLAQQVVPHANTAVDLGGIFQTFSSHATDMIDYAAWLCPMEDVNRLFNFKYKDGKGIPTGKTVKGILDRVGGPGSQEYWSNLMVDIQNGIDGPGDSFLDIIASQITSNIKGASVGANIRVIVQQPTAIIRATAVMNPAYLALGGKGVTKGSGWKKALKYAEIAQRKNRGGFEISNPMQMSEILFDDRTGLARFNDAMQKGAAAADALTWGCIWNACEHQVKHETNLEVGSEAFYKKVAEVFTEVIEESQVVDGVLQRSQAMRSSSRTAKQMTAFMGEPTMSLNMFLRAYDDWRYEQNGPKKAKAGRKLARVGATLVATDLLTALAQSLIDAIRDDDKDKKYWERFWKAFTGLDGDEETFWEHVWAIYLSGNAANTVSVIGKMPYAKDFKSLVQGYSVERLDISGIADLIDAGVTVVDKLKGEGARTWPYTVKQLATAGSKLFGISASNILRDVWGIARGVAVETGNIEVQYEMEKAIYNIANEKNKGRFYDILFSALKQGDIENYNIIRKDLMTEMGLAGNNIDSAMKERYTKALKNDPGMSFPQQSQDIIGIFAKYDHSKPEEKFGADDLDADAYTAYSKQLANDRREIMDGLEADPIFRGADGKFKDTATSAARKLVEEQALEDHSDGQYEITIQWIKYADEAEAKGIEPCSYALFRAAYTTTEGEEKSDKIRDWLEDNRTLTESQREFLWSTVYKSEW